MWVSNFQQDSTKVLSVFGSWDISEKLSVMEVEVVDWFFEQYEIMPKFRRKA